MDGYSPGRIYVIVDLVELVPVGALFVDTPLRRDIYIGLAKVGFLCAQTPLRRDIYSSKPRDSSSPCAHTPLRRYLYRSRESGYPMCANSTEERFD